MVGADDSRAFLVEQRNVGQQPLAELGVRLHPPALGWSEAARLEQDAVGNADLPDVVQEEAPFEARIVE
jgi:hypothetical protein